METCAISVTEASRNFSNCVNRARYQGTNFLLLKAGIPVARIVPAPQRPTRGIELADALCAALADVHLSEKEATSWLHDLEQAHAPALPQVSPWRY
jgi:antitoxin (DNA-binding transcriptional repressor) of toxin-antitoxin stability system